MPIKRKDIDFIYLITLLKLNNFISFKVPKFN